MRWLEQQWWRRKSLRKIKPAGDWDIQESENWKHLKIIPLQKPRQTHRTGQDNYRAFANLCNKMVPINWKYNLAGAYMTMTFLQLRWIMTSASTVMEICAFCSPILYVALGIRTLEITKTPQLSLFNYSIISDRATNNNSWMIRWSPNNNSTCTTYQQFTLPEESNKASSGINLDLDWNITSTIYWLLSLFSSLW